jgi:amyloid beta (A4) precursor protein-binding family B protein 2 (Fe65-like)
MFLGQIQVSKPCGVDVINEAIDNLANRTPMDQWKMVSVMVAPSTVTINFTDGKSVQEEPPIDCRVRFLSFLGIGRNDQKCAFIMHTAQDTFVAYAFHCEGSAGPLCKTIEAACKLRYQKCLDARPRDKASQGRNDGSGGSLSGSLSVGDTERRSISSTLKNMFGSIASRKSQTNCTSGSAENNG